MRLSTRGLNTRGISLMSSNVIILNADMSYHQMVPWQTAVCMVLKGTAEEVVPGERHVRSISLEIIVPKVMRLVRYVRTRFYMIHTFRKSIVFLRDGHTCQYCGKKLDKGKCTLDHIKPKCQGGKTAYTNCVTACVPCNTRKGSKTNIKPATIPKNISSFDYMKLRFPGITNECSTV